MTTCTNPALAAAEQHLIASVRKVASAVSGIGCGELDAALAELQREAAAAADRINGAREFVAQTLGELMQTLAGLAGELHLGCQTHLPSPGPLCGAALEYARQDVQQPADGPESCTPEMLAVMQARNDAADRRVREIDEAHAVAREWPEAPLPEPKVVGAPLSKEEADVIREELRHWDPASEEVFAAANGLAMTQADKEAASARQEQEQTTSSADLARQMLGEDGVDLGEVARKMDARKRGKGRKR